MTACDECWDNAFGIARRTGRHQAEVYRELIATNPEHPLSLGRDDNAADTPYEHNWIE